MLITFPTTPHPRRPETDTDGGGDGSDGTLQREGSGGSSGGGGGTGGTGGGGCQPHPHPALRSAGRRARPRVLQSRGHTREPRSHSAAALPVAEIDPEALEAYNNQQQQQQQQRRRQSHQVEHLYHQHQQQQQQQQQHPHHHHGPTVIVQEAPNGMPPRCADCSVTCPTTLLLSRHVRRGAVHRSFPLPDGTFRNLAGMTNRPERNVTSMWRAIVTRLFSTCSELNLSLSLVSKKSRREVSSSSIDG